MRQQSLWDGARLTMEEAMEITLRSLQAYGGKYRHWALAWSGGKDSTANDLRARLAIAEKALLEIDAKAYSEGFVDGQNKCADIAE